MFLQPSILLKCVVFFGWCNRFIVLFVDPFNFFYSFLCFHQESFLFDTRVFNSSHWKMKIVFYSCLVYSTFIICFYFYSISFSICIRVYWYFFIRLFGLSWRIIPFFSTFFNVIFFCYHFFVTFSEQFWPNVWHRFCMCSLYAVQQLELVLVHQFHRSYWQRLYRLHSLWQR